MDIAYSVLMSVYYKEKPEYLKLAMESIYNQTIQTDDFVLVCDGPLSDGLDKVICEMQLKFGDILKVIRLDKNIGLGNALNTGIKYCKNELIARMDSDDISYLDRCERQIAIFSSNNNISICGGIVEEFTDNIEQVQTMRITPEYHKDILEFSKKRNPFNHPCVMYRKSSVEAAGGYQHFYLLEDYYLWLRMMMNGAVGYNIQEPLLWMRAGNDMYKRRSGWKYAVSQKKLLRFMYDNRLITLFQYSKNVVIRTVSSLVPNSVRISLYKYLLR